MYGHADPRYHRKINKKSGPHHTENSRNARSPLQRIRGVKMSRSSCVVDWSSQVLDWRSQPSGAMNEPVYLHSFRLVHGDLDRRDYSDPERSETQKSDADRPAGRSGLGTVA